MNRLYIVLIVVLSGLCTSCNKYLEEKPAKEQLVPGKIQDLLALLDGHEAMNEKTTPLGEVLADNLALRAGIFNVLDLLDRQNYIWDAQATQYISWRTQYQYPIYYANVVLDELKDMKVSSRDAGLADYVRGAALFYKAFAYQRLSDLYAPPYSTANLALPGIVMRSSGNIAIASYRANVEETYKTILEYLQEAVRLLPVQTDKPTRPSKAAAFGLLARTLLSMRDYTEAGKYSDSALQYQRSLIDFNTLTPGLIPRFNKETIFYNHASSSTTLLLPAFARVDTNLVRTYEDNDLRRSIFFLKRADGSFTWQGSYDGEYNPYMVFDGITVDELMLIRSECLIRSGNFQAGMDTLNSLLSTRWKKDALGVSTYVNKVAANAQDALEVLLTERRKELVFRALRWSDIRRLNLEGRNIELVRNINGIQYSLPANDKRSVLLIPLEVTSLTNIPQTAR